MYVYSSYSRGAMLRRQCDLTVRGLLNFRSRRNLFAASALHFNEKTISGRDGFFTWLKDIFNKSAKDKSRKTDTAIVDRAATATTFNRSEKRPADSSDKVDIVNQKLANFCTARSTTKFKYGNIRAEKRDAENGGRAYTIQQSAIYTTSQSNRFAAEKTFERGIEPDSSWRDPGKMYRSERNCGAIEFAARDDLDVTSHYRCYMSPRHCYRLPPQRTKQPLMGLCAPNRYIGMPSRALVGFAPRNTKPPIKEPNAPEKHEKKDEKKDKKEKKKPVIRTDGESVDSSENRAEMVADDNPRNDPDATFRYEWGVKLAEEQPAAEAASDNDKFAEKGQQYVTKQLWGVNLIQPKPDIASPATASSERDTEKSRNASSNFESGDITTDAGAKTDAVPMPNDSAKKSSLKGTTADYLSTPSRQTDSSDDVIEVQNDSDDTSSYMNSKELRKIMRTSPNILKETIIVDKEYNVPEGADLDTEIKAWQNLGARSAPEVKENYLSSDEENLENLVSIRPEAPQPKLDVRIVRSTEDDLKDKEQPNSGYASPKAVEIKQVGSSQRPDGHFTGKKLHTISTQIRYIHRNNITQRYVEPLLSNSAPFSKNIRTKYPGLISAFSTNPEDSMQKESVSQNEKNSNDPTDSNDTPNSNRSSLSIESQKLSSSDQEQADLAETLDMIADKEMEISINQLRSRKKNAHLSDSIVSSEFTQEDKSRYRDEEAQEETERYEKSHVKYEDKNATYVEFNNQSTNSESVKSDAIKSTNEDSNNNSSTFDSNVKDADDDLKKGILDGDYVRLPGDPYPYSREHLEKWRVPRSRSLIHKSWTREMSRSSDSSTVVQSTLRNANDAYANAAGEPRDSHADDAVMEISGSGGDGGAKKRMGQANGFHVSSQDQRVVSDCLRGDAADVLGLLQWTEAFSRLDVDEKMNEAAQSDDNAPFRARYE
ncbi:PREDICTED: dentin sialophosphoprotein-like [Cyphomyrmex costatus]|uniref:dentin sialophosphoprotein-like n=1 Tax=Cyphomyrmex costatus TaxID=456900 RepID=UPI0008523512|nr:PREDICTED: dentin sialophosphoprotein-like [Cyphomyrmex costatus]